MEWHEAMDALWNGKNATVSHPSDDPKLMRAEAKAWGAYIHSWKKQS